MNEAISWQEEKEKIISQRDRYKEYLSCVLQWLELLEDGANLRSYFKEHNCSQIAVYGAAEIGRVLRKEVECDSAIQVLYFLDRNAKKQKEKWGVPVYLPEEFAVLPDVDMVVVTAITSFADIWNNLMRIRPEIPVVSLKTMIEVRKDEVWHAQR